jgi:hypothetical protein
MQIHKPVSFFLSLFREGKYFWRIKVTKVTNIENNKIPPGIRHGQLNEFPQHLYRNNCSTYLRACGALMFLLEPKGGEEESCVDPFYILVTQCCYINNK